MSLPAIVPLHHDPAYPPPPQPGGGEPPIFLPLPNTDIGYVYRGDTILLPPWEARDYYHEIIDLTAAQIWFTAKVDLEEDDTDPGVIQSSTHGSTIEILGDPTNGLYAVMIAPDETHDLLDDTVFIFDVQVITGNETPNRTLTVKRGLMTVIRDVTRAQG